MTSTTANVDYIRVNFEYPVLTKISGKPDYESLKAIKNELKANAGKVQCDLGGGNNGHLGLILTDEEYARVSNTPYVRPVHPGPVAPVGTTQYQSTILRDEHKENIRLYREANAVEEALLKQLSSALPDLYLKQYRNKYSNKITTPLRTILRDLFTTHGAISDEELLERETTLRARVFEIQEPLNALYQAVEDLQELAIASSSPFTDKQLVGLGLQLIKNMNDYEKARGEWLNKDPADKTWNNFKIHFTAAYTYLHQLRGPTMRSTTFQQQANYITQQILAAVQQDRDNDKAEIFQKVEETEKTILEAMSVVPEIRNEEQDVNSSITPSVNSTSSDKIQLRMLEILQKIDAKLDNTSKPDPNKKSGKRKRRNLTHYCWTHGAGNHKSSDCRNKKEGHQDDATLKNRMGGSNFYCKAAKAALNENSE